MRNVIIFLALAVCLIMAGCKGNQKGKEHFSKKEAELIDIYNVADSIYYIEGRIDTAAFGLFVRKAMEFAKQHPDDKIAPEMLYRAGIGSMILAKAAPNQDEMAKNAKTALSIFHTFQDKYPNDEQAKYCYYQRGIIYDDIIGDVRSAEDEFRDFIHLYPNDSLAPQLQQYLKIMGKSEEEIMAAIEQMGN